VVPIDRYSFKDIPLDLIFIVYSLPLVKEHKTVKRDIMQIPSHLLVIFKHRGKFMVAVLVSI
jgi:hypothetical protein